MTDALGLVGQRLREYEVLELVGRGGMGAVYRARHVLLQEERAIKVVSRKPADDREFTERFIREARVLARLKDEHLVRLYEFWEDHGQLFMALEFLRGESVAQRLKARGRLGIGETVAIARDAARGLQAAHEQNVVHRDISPDNLQLVRGADGGEIVKVMDFGIAKALEEASAELTANMFLGKLEYASPEQCGYGLEKGEHIDRRSDVYSLGVTVFKMATGSLPFSAATAQGYLFKHAAEAPPPPSAMAPDAGIPLELDRLVLKALAKRRGERQQTMAELIQELEKIPVGPRTHVEQPTVAWERPEATARPGHASPSPVPGTGVGKTGALKIGDNFARKYVIKSLLGEGGMGVVYRAVDTILDEPVALKVISERLVGGQDAVERLKREVVLARRVSHPNVCRIYDIGESEAGVPYVSMEYVDGRPLSDLIAESAPMTQAEGIPLIRQVLDALAAAHRVNVIHRDLKPDNIMVTRDARAVIMDFGLSLSEDSRRVTQAGSVIGTPHYMAPEQVRGGNVDPRADLYAIGVILFRMFTGRLPFSGGIVEILRGHLETAPPRPSELNPKVPHDLETIILTALQKDAGLRFASAEGFLLALDPVAPATVRKSTESGRVVRVPRTQKAPLAGSSPTQVEGDEDQEAVRRYLAQPTLESEAQATRDLGRTAEPTRAAPAQKIRVAPRPAASASRAWLPAAFAAAAVAAGGVGYYLMQPAPPLTDTPPGTLGTPPVSTPPVTAPPLTLVPPTTQGPPPSTLTTPPTTSRPAPATTTLRPAPTAPPPTLPPPTTAPPVTAPPVTAPPATVATPPPTTPPKPALSPEQGVRAAIGEFADALSKLDREGVRRVFPNFPDKNFEGLANFKAYRVSVEVRKLTVEASRVVVEARTRHTFTSFSGKEESRTQNEKMVFIEGGRGWVRVE
jgi:serine/threonine-protein kinase